MTNLRSPKCTISTLNSSTTNLDSGNSYTYTGTWEQTFDPDVMINFRADQECTVLLQFSNDGVVLDSTLTKLNTTNINEFSTSVKGARFFRVVISSDSLTTALFRLQVQYGVFRQGNAPANLTLSLDADAINVRPTIAQDEIRIGRRAGITGFTKFAYRDGLVAADGEQVIWTATDNDFVPMETADTYTITYDGTGGGSTDGAGTTGARTLAITHVNANGDPETFLHTLGTDGSDETTQSGFGINRAAVASNGGLTYNASDITITDTTNGNTQAHIRTTNSVTEQAIFVTGSNHDAVAKWLYLNLNKVSGGGNVRATIKGYIYSRAVDTRYLIFRSLIDTSVASIVDITDPIGFNFSPTDVIWFTVDTDTNNSEIDLRFSLNEYQRT